MAIFMVYLTSEGGKVYDIVVKADSVVEAIRSAKQEMLNFPSLKQANIVELKAEVIKSTFQVIMH